MGSILETIAASNRKRVGRAYEDGTADFIRLRARMQAAEEGTFNFPFEQALRGERMAFICECKRASPSKGLIATDYDPAAIARSYERAGAAAISCLTEPRWFKGSGEHLRCVATSVALPVLRKDFVVDDVQIFEAKCWGAAAVLLICSILDDAQLAHSIALCHDLGLTALVEAYEREEVPRALRAGARVVGVNNRDLRTFSVDFGRSIEMRALVGPDRLFVSESGVETCDDVQRLEEAGVDAVLIGETLMRAADKGAMLDELKGTSR